MEEYINKEKLIDIWIEKREGLGNDYGVYLMEEMPVFERRNQ